MTMTDPPSTVEAVHPALARLEQSGTLSARVRHSVAWTASYRIVMQVVSVGSQMALARLLLPQDFGVVALAGVVTSFAGLLTSLGLATAVVQSRVVTERLLSCAFWVSVLAGVVVSTALALAAPAVAHFYGDARVAPLLQVGALAFVLNLGVVHEAMLQRSLRFKALGALEAIATTIGLGATVAMAAAGLGAFSLVLGSLANTVVMTALVWWRVRWLPRSFVHRAELRQLWRFGRGMVGSNVLYFVSRNADTALLGRVVGAGDLGLYSRSYAMMMAPLGQVTGVLTRVLLPAYAEVQGDLARLRRAWISTTRASLAVGVPVGIGVAVSAPALVETLYGERWLGMVPVVVLLAASVPPQIIARNIGPMYQAVGKTDALFVIGLINTALTLVAIVIGLPGGIVGVAMALLVNSYVGLAVPLVPALRLIGMQFREFAAVVGGAALTAAALAAAGLGVGQLLVGSPPWVVLAAQVAASASAYFVVLHLVNPGAARTVVAVLRRRRARASGQPS